MNLPGEQFIDIEEVNLRSNRNWKWINGVPFVDFDWKCGSCGNPFFVYRQWRYHVRSGSHRTKFRVDCSIKCNDCAMVYTFGIVIPKELDGQKLMGLGLIDRNRAIKRIE